MSECWKEDHILEESPLKQERMQWCEMLSFSLKFFFYILTVSLKLYLSKTPNSPGNWFLQKLNEKSVPWREQMWGHIWDLTRSNSQQPPKSSEAILSLEFLPLANAGFVVTSLQASLKGDPAEKTCRNKFNPEQQCPKIVIWWLLNGTCTRQSQYLSKQESIDFTKPLFL